MTSKRAMILLRQRPPGNRIVDELSSIFPAVEFCDGLEDEVFLRELYRADAVIGGQWSEELVDKAPLLRWVQSIYAGVDDLPLQAFARRGIQVTNFRGVSAVSLSEHVLALMFAFARGLPEFLRRQREHVWLPQAERPALFELEGQRVGILGIGALGSAVAERCHRQSMEVVTCVRSARPLPDHIHASYPWTGLTDMLAIVDHLVLALPSSPETRGLIGGTQLAALKRGAYLYNVGRGDAVDTEALLDALRTGHVAGAGLDVTAPEPLPPRSALWDLPNVIITGHTAGISPKRWDRGMEVVTENIKRFVRGEPLMNSAGPAHTTLPPSGGRA